MKIIETTVFVFGFLVSSTHTYTECVSMSYFGCTVCYEMNGDTFTFTSCKERYCARYENDYSDQDYDQVSRSRSRSSSSSSRYSSNTRRSSRNRRRRCVRYAYYNYSEDVCLTECCGVVGEGKATFTKDLVEKCKKENDRLSAQLGIILGSVFGGIFLIVGSFIFYKWRKDHY